MTTPKSYTELSKIDDYLERFNYLKLSGAVGKETFGHERYLNQIFYSSPEWRCFRDRIIVRDKGCDMGVADHEIHTAIVIHHINPITPDDILKRSGHLFDEENVICVSAKTHQAIHYGDKDLLSLPMQERTQYDTCPWRK